MPQAAARPVNPILDKNVFILYNKRQKISCTTGAVLYNYVRTHYNKRLAVCQSAFLIGAKMQVPSKENSINQIVSNFHDMVSSHAPTQIGLGVVLQEPPELQIAWNNIIIEPAQIYISDFLLLGYTRNYKGKWQAEQMKGTIKTQTNSRKGGGGDPAFRSHTHKVNDDYKASDNEAEYKESAVSMDYGLKAGDIVTMLPINNAQQFIVLSRLVYLPEYVPPEGNE